MSNDIKLNRTSHCSLCAEEKPGREDVRNMVRFRLGDPNGPPRIAVCPTHDMIIRREP